MRTTLVSLCLMASVSATGQPEASKALPACQLALTACGRLVDAQAAELAHLHQDVKGLEDSIKDSQSGSTLSKELWFLLGAAAGVTAYRLISGH